MRFQAVGAHRAVAPLAERRRRLPRRQVADEQAVRHERRALRRHALVVVAEGAQAAGNRRVGRQIDGLGAVAEVAQLLRGQEAGARVRRLRAQHAVQLDGVAAALVDLQGELAAVEDDRRDAGRAGLCREQRRRLLGDARRVPGQVVAFHELPALRALVPPDAVRIRALLHLALSSTAVASMPQPVSIRSCSMKLPSLLPNVFFSR